MGIKEDLAERGTIEKKCRDLVNKVESEKRSWSAEDEKEWGTLIARDDELKASIERQEKLDKIKRDLGRKQRHGISRRTNPATGIDRRQHDQGEDDPDHRDDPTGPTEAQRRTMFNAWGRRQLGHDLTRDELKVCKEFSFNPGKRHLDLRLSNTEDYNPVAEEMRNSHPRRLKRDLNVATGANGLYTIPTGFVNRLEMAMLWYGPMLRYAEVMRTESGNDLPWPTVNDTGNEGALLAEATSIGSSVDPTFAQTTLKAFKFSSKLVLVSDEILEDSGFNLDAILPNMLGERLGRIQNKKATIGAGTTEPKGIVVESTLGKTAASATAIADTELLDLVHSVDVAYRDQPGVGFMMNDGILLAIRKLKDSEGQFIFQSGLQLGVPDRLLGYQVAVNNHMAATVAASAKTILFGKLDSYKIRQVKGVRIKRLVERYADTDQVGFVAFLRMDGRLINAGGNPVKHLIQAAS